MEDGSLPGASEKIDEGELVAGLYDLFLSEYGGYTLAKIEDELTWEQLYLLGDTILKRLDRRTPRQGSPAEAHYDLDDIADGKVPNFTGLALVRKEVK